MNPDLIINRPGNRFAVAQSLCQRYGASRTAGRWVMRRQWQVPAVGLAPRR